MEEPAIKEFTKVETKFFGMTDREVKRPTVQTASYVTTEFLEGKLNDFQRRVLIALDSRLPKLPPERREEPPQQFTTPEVPIQLSKTPTYSEWVGHWGDRESESARKKKTKSGRRRRDDDYDDDNDESDDESSEDEKPIRRPSRSKSYRRKHSESEESESESEEEVDSEDEDDVPVRKRRSGKNSGKRSKTPPRESILKRIAKQSEEPRNTVQYTEPRPSYSHIKLTDLKVTSVKKFINQVVDYQTVYGIPLPVTNQIDEKIRETLLSRNKGLTSQKFHSLDVSSVIDLLQELIRPRTVLEFTKALERSVYFPDLPRNYTPTPVNFQLFYDAILEYKKNFLTVFEILAEHNKKHIPPLKYNDGGLLKLFVDKIPFNYGTSFIKGKKSRTYENIYDFLRRFSKSLDKHYDTALESRSMQQNFGGTAYFSNAAKNTSAHNQPPPKRFDNRSRHTAPSRQRLNFLDQSDIDIEDELSAALGFSAALEEESEYYEDTSRFSTNDLPADLVDEPPLHPVSQANSANREEPEVDVDDSAEQQLNELVAANAAARDKAKGKYGSGQKPEIPNGCFLMLMDGQCPRGDKCSYSHSTAMLQKTHAYVSQKLKTSKYAVQKPASLSNIAMQEEFQLQSSLEKYDGLYQFDPALQDCFHQAVLHAIPEASFLSPVHCGGNICLPRSDVFIAKVLFDSGALHGSYMSENFLDRHREILQPYVVPCNVIVTLADNKTRVGITERVVLPLQFKDSHGEDHTGKISLYVFGMTENDVIIGLPHIVLHFSELFKNMIDEAVKANVYSTDLASMQQSDIIASSEENLIMPWTATFNNDEAPEDAATPLPCSFTDALHYMEMPYEDAVQEFLNLIPTHVAKEFIEATDIVSLLEDKGKRVFVPSNWEGINGTPPLELEWKDTLPAKMKPRARPINPRLYENAKKEFDRLLKYFYVPSTSDIASCLVIAPKATAPFIRFCGDYVDINKHIAIGHYPIPNVQHELQKISTFRVFLDFDLVNAFHQRRLAPLTSKRLSIQTPWGQYEPLFMPEGIGPASGVLQKDISEIFRDFSEWCIAIFDNLLVLANDYADARVKCEKILDRCLERNVFLKFSKTWLGFDHANFFGYVVRFGCYELSQDRKDAIKAIPFPTTMKKMQSFLGAALFFKSFVPNYSTLTAPLHDMLKKDFVWDPGIWTCDYEAVFEHLKQALQKAVAIFYPNYDLPWILRVDASKVGVGAVLSQKAIGVDGREELQPIAFVSQKFSEQATRWKTIEQEAYSCYFGVFKLSYYLHCKEFILETDHNNLLWMEASLVPKIMRWRIYLQSFNFLIRHIPGKLNVVADYFSRVHESNESTDKTTTLSLVQERYADNEFEKKPVIQLEDNAVESNDAPADAEDALGIGVDEGNQPGIDPDVLLGKVHGGRMGHFGARETWKQLNRLFPGRHRIPYRVVQEFVAKCPVCQKDRLGMVDTLEPVILHLKPIHKRSVIGIDTLTITPPDKDGNQYLIVIVNHFTKFTVLFAVKDHDALSVATALFQYCCWYGLFDSILSDPGSEFMNEVIRHLTSWFGIRHVFSLVDRHESNGVEGTNKQILRHLKALVFDERVKDRWSSPTVLPLIQFIINSHESSETGVVPFHAHFGSADATYFRMPEPGEEGDSTQRVHAYIKLLDENLRVLTDISKRHQQKLVQERTNKTSEETQAKFQPGDLVLFQRNPSEMLPSKLSPKFIGPYSVLEQHKNDVKCQHVVMGSVQVFHVSRLKLFLGTFDEAKKVAMIDHDQFQIDRFIAYRGEPLVRTTVEFEVLFQDGTKVWLPWSKDLFDTVQYEDFCRSRPELYLLLFDAKSAAVRIRELNKVPITAVVPGDTVYVDIRSYGATWYNGLDLPDPDHTDYLVEYKYTKWANKARTKIHAACKVFGEVFIVDHDFVKRYGSRRTTTDNNNNKVCVIDDDMVKRYPKLLP